MTGTLPAWVIKDSTTGQLKLHDGRAKVVRRIFQEATRDVGHHTIARRFNREKVPAITQKKSSKAWYSSYALKILHNPAVIGQYQPCKIVNGKRVPVGEILPDYLPRVIPDSLYYKVREIRASRRIPSGPKGDNGGNLFQGLARCHKCGSAMHKVSKGKAATEWDISCLRQRCSR